MSDIDTPCIKICMLDAEGKYCLGCGRTRNEVADWMFMSDEERGAIMARLEARRADLKNRE